MKIALINVNGLPEVKDVNVLTDNLEGGKSMKKTLFLISTVTALALIMVAGAANATFTMTPTQLQALYETYENPSSAGTYLNPVQATSGGAKYTGNVTTNTSGWGQIQIGANFWGIPFGGSAGDEPTNSALGMGDLSAYNAYALSITNLNENPWMFNVYMNIGYTDPGWDDVDYYVQGNWTSIGVGETATILLDFTNCEFWMTPYSGGSPSGATQNLTGQNITSLGLLDHVSNIGINVGGDMPVGPEDYTFEFKVAPVPEPSTVLLIGIGLVGLAGYGFRKRNRNG